MHISSLITKINNSFRIGSKKNQPTLEEFINRGFAPKNDKIDILFINPPSTISERYGKDDMGEVGGDLIPLGMASLAAYIREKGFGVGVLDCPTLRINNDDVYKISLDKKLVIIVGNAISEESFINQKNDVYYINSLTKNMNFDFIKPYKIIIIVEPYFGNILERKIRKRNFFKKKILTIGYDETIVHKYGNKKKQDIYLKFNEKNIIKKANDFN